MSEAKKKGYVPTTFRDAGTGETFEGGREHMFEPGAEANYRAAGKVTDAPVKETPAAKEIPADVGKAKTAA